MFVADTAAVIASLLAFVTLVPQLNKLWRTQDAEGVSASWAAFGAVSNGAWTIYLFYQDLWLALPATTAMVLFYALIMGLIARAGRSIVPALNLGTLWALVLAAAGIAGGWSVLGLFLGFSVGVQAVPSLWTAFRSRVPTGISPGTWQLILVEGLLWLVYGAGYSDTAIVLFGIISTISSILILARFYSTRHRMPIEAPASLLRVPE